MEENHEQTTVRIENERRKDKETTEKNRERMKILDIIYIYENEEITS